MFDARMSIPELAVLGCGVVGEVEIDAAAAALRRGKLNQSPSFGLVPGAEIWPRDWSGQPAQLGKAVGEQRIADQSASIDADPVAAARQSRVHFLEIGHDIGQFIRRAPRPIHAEINRTASRLSVLGGEDETALRV